MFTVKITQKDGPQQVINFEQEQVQVGRIKGNDIVLPKNNISKQHALFTYREGALAVSDSRSTNGTWVNSERIHESRTLKSGDKIYLGEFLLEVVHIDDSISLDPALTDLLKPSTGIDTGTLDEILPDEEWGSGEKFDDNWSGEWRDSAVRNLADIEPSFSAIETSSDLSEDLASISSLTPIESPDAVAPHVEIASFDPGGNSGFPLPLDVEISSDGIVGAVPSDSPEPKEPEESQEPDVAPELAELTTTSIRAVFSTLATDETLDLTTADQPRIQSAVSSAIESMLTHNELAANTDVKTLEDAVLAEATGLGPLGHLLEDESVASIMVNGPDQIFVERSGNRESTEYQFSSAETLNNVISRLLKDTDYSDSTRPIITTRLTNGATLNIVTSAAAPQGACITIRKSRTVMRGIGELLEAASLSPAMASFLQVSVTAGKNILIVGQKNVGKTTTLNALTSYIPSSARLVAVEQSPELNLNHTHLVRLVVDGSGVDSGKLVEHAAALEADRLIVGGLEPSAANQMVQAIYHGCTGTLATMIALSEADAIARLEAFLLSENANLSLDAARVQLASTLSLVVHQQQFADGTRRITDISEVTGYGAEGILLKKIFSFSGQGQGVTGKFKPTGHVPEFYQQLPTDGIQADTSIFHLQ